jgi:hypothetical protein
MTLRRILLGALVLMMLAWGLEYWALDAWRSAHKASLRLSEGATPDAVSEVAPLADWGSSAFALAALKPADWSELVERPKFVPSRRPPDVVPEVEPEPETVEPDPAAEPLRATLRSVVIGPETAQVWLQPGDAAALIKLRPGERYEGWRLEAVEPQGATFVIEDATQVLPLRPSGSLALEIDRVTPAVPPPPLR